LIGLISRARPAIGSIVGTVTYYTGRLPTTAIASACIGVVALILFVTELGVFSSKRRIAEVK